MGRPHNFTLLRIKSAIEAFLYLTFATFSLATSARAAQSVKEKKVVCMSDTALRPFPTEGKAFNSRSDKSRNRIRHFKVVSQVRKLHC